MRGCRSCFEPRQSTGTGETASSLGSQPNWRQGILETNPPAPSTLETNAARDMHSTIRAICVRSGTCARVLATA